MGSSPRPCLFGLGSLAVSRSAPQGLPTVHNAPARSGNARKELPTVRNAATPCRPTRSPGPEVRRKGCPACALPWRRAPTPAPPKNLGSEILLILQILWGRGGSRRPGGCLAPFWWELLPTLLKTDPKSGPLPRRLRTDPKWRLRKDRYQEAPDQGRRPGIATPKPLRVWRVFLSSVRPWR